MPTIFETLALTNLQEVHEANDMAAAINEKADRVRVLVAEAKAQGCEFEETILNLFHALAARKTISERPEVYDAQQLAQFVLTAREGVAMFSAPRPRVPAPEASALVALFELQAELAGTALLFREESPATC